MAPNVDLSEFDVGTGYGYNSIENGIITVEDRLDAEIVRLLVEMGSVTDPENDDVMADLAPFNEVVAVITEQLGFMFNDPDEEEWTQVAEYLRGLGSEKGFIMPTGGFTPLRFGFNARAVRVEIADADEDDAFFISRVRQKVFYTDV